MKSKIKILGAVLFLFLLAQSFVNAATNDQLIVAIDAEKESLSKTYLVTYSTAAESRYLKVYFHHALLAHDVAEKTAVLSLGADDIKRLQEKKLTVEPALAYRQRRTQQLDQSLLTLLEKVELENNISSSRSTNSLVVEEISQIESSSTVLTAATSPPVISGIPGFPCYPTVEETIDTAHYLVASYPQYSEMIDIGDSWEKTQDPGAGYDLWVMKITNENIVREKPVLFIQSAMHAREYSTAALTLDFAKLLLEEYQANADIRWIVDFHEIQILFHMNPDGRKIAETGLLKRKNTNNTHCSSGSLVQYGVDLNRNYTFFRGARVAEPGNSSDRALGTDSECAETFRGPFAASEPETAAVEAYARMIFPDERGSNDTDPAPSDKKGLFLDIHSFGNLILFPFSHTRDMAPNGEALRRLARRLAYFNNYNPVQGPELYFVNGSSESIAYGELGIAHLTFELGNTFFEACETYERTIRPDNLEALVHAAKVALAPYEIPKGPYFEDFLIKGRLVPDITSGAVIEFSALINDNVFNQLNGEESVQSVSTVEYSLDRHFYDPDVEIADLRSEIQAGGSVLDETREIVDVRLEGISQALDFGRHTLFLRATDSEGNVGAIVAREFSIIEGAYLEPVIDYDCNYNRCRFRADASLDTDGDIQLYRWLVDNTAFEGDFFRYDFKSNGTFQIVLEVVGEDGEIVMANEQLVFDLEGAAPIVDYNYSCDGLSCTFDASATTDPDNNLSQFRWRYGDGNETEANLESIIANHRYQEYGIYEVQLVVRDESGWRFLETIEITLADPDSSSGLVSSEEGSSTGGGGSVGLHYILLMLFFSVARISQAGWCICEEEDAPATVV